LTKTAHWLAVTWSCTPTSCHNKCRKWWWAKGLAFTSAQRQTKGLGMCLHWLADTSHRLGTSPAETGAQLRVKSLCQSQATASARPPHASSSRPQERAGSCLRSEVSYAQGSKAVAVGVRDFLAQDLKSGSWRSVKPVHAFGANFLANRPFSTVVSTKSSVLKPCDTIQSSSMNLLM